MNPFIHYITHWYSDPDLRRHAEQTQAIRRQAADPLIVSKALLAMNADAPIRAIQIDHRPTFAELASHGRDDGTVNLLMNSDCYIDPADTPMLEYMGSDVVWCLSREDNRNPTSQDAWAWRGQMDVPQATYTQGIPGCDNRFAFDCALDGRVLTNPSLSIQVHHLHASNVRNWTEANRIPHPYLFVSPVQLGEPSAFEFRGSDEDRDKLKGISL